MLDLIKSTLKKSDMQWARLIGREVISGLNITTWANLKNGDYLKVDLSNSVGRSIWLRGEYCPVIEKVLHEKLLPGNTFIDIGANIGYFSLVAAKLVGKTGSVFSFEPIPKTAGLIKQTIRKNDTSQITVEQIALGSTPGNTSMQVQVSSGVSYIGDNTNRRPEDRVKCEINVPIGTLDDYVKHNNVTSINLMKIDVEGYEVNVLKGAIEVLKRQKPDLIIEIVPKQLERFGCNHIDIFQLLSEIGYTAYDLETGRNIDYNSLPQGTTDFLFSSK